VLPARMDDVAKERARFTDVLPPAVGGIAGTPHSPTALLPGKISIISVILSSIALGMLHELLGSLSPPIRPGHLSIPASPASQLSMIC
jgi:hypothetical protein